MARLDFKGRILLLVLGAGGRSSIGKEHRQFKHFVAPVPLEHLLPAPKSSGGKEAAQLTDDSI